MRIIYLKNFRRGLATNSSSTHSLIYKNDDELFKDLNIFELNFYGRCDNTIAATKEAKIKYVLADIKYNEPLVQIMSSIYPEMKQYYPLIKKSFEDTDKDVFGMYCRGRLYFDDNLEASVDYLKNVIEDPSIIIVGGSDEQDFVYDTIEGHEQCPDPDMIDYESKNRYGIYKNGNYWVGYGHTHDHVSVRTEENEWDSNETPIRNSFCGKIRFMTQQSEEPVPEFPELIDLKITNKCNHGCKFCFMSSNMKGKHADIGFLLYVVRQCTRDKRRVEFSIGGGNILLYPQLDVLVKQMHESGHFVNVTINAADCKSIIDDEKMMSIFTRYVDGIGVSVTDVNDIDELCRLYQTFNANRISYDKSYKFIVCHLIPEYLGVVKTREIMDTLRNKKKVYIPYLFLGYKTNGRGATQKYEELDKEALDMLFSGYSSTSIDTTFANRYFWYIKDNFSFKHTITRNEGEYSMYIDGVTETAYKSSYQLDTPYSLHIDYSHPSDTPSYHVEEAFAKIRKDNGFKTYKDIQKHYYDEQQ